MWVVVHRQNQWEVAISNLKEGASKVVQREPTLERRGEKRVVQTPSILQGNPKKPSPPDTLYIPPTPPHYLWSPRKQVWYL